MSRDEAIEEFISKLEFAKKDEIYIDIPIRNVAVKNEIEGILDENNILLHSQINTKIFRIRIDDLLDLSIILESNDGKPVDDIRKQIIDKLRLNDRNLISISQDIDNFDDNEVYSKFKNKLVKSTVDVGLELIRSFVPGGGIACSIIEKLMKNFGVLQNV